MDRSDFLTKLDEILTASQRESGVAEKLMPVLSAKTLERFARRGAKTALAQELKTVLDQLKKAGVHAVFDRRPDARLRLLYRHRVRGFRH